MATEDILNRNHANKEEKAALPIIALFPPSSNKLLPLKYINTN